MGIKSIDKLLGGLKGLIKVHNIVIDNFIFRLHTKFTVALLLAFSLLITARQYFGDPIDCISRDDFPSDLLDTFCWIHGTFSVMSAWNKKVGIEVPYPGVDKSPEDNTQLIYHKYYQWVCFALFIQGIFFYIPHFWWKSAEGNCLKTLLMDLDQPIMPIDKCRERKRTLVSYFINNLHHHRIYALNYYIAEITLFINVLVQIYFVDMFLGGEFTLYGVNVLSFTDWDPSLRYDPMIRVFPRVAKCTFHRFGSSGDVQIHDAMCILPINIINEKVYIILWFWFYALMIITGILLIYRCVQWLCPPLRVMIVRMRSRQCQRHDIENVLNHCYLSDWFLLSLLQKNMAADNFKDVIIQLSHNLQCNHKSDPFNDDLKKEFTNESNA